EHAHLRGQAEGEGRRHAPEAPRAEGGAPPLRSLDGWRGAMRCERGIAVGTEPDLGGPAAHHPCRQREHGELGEGRRGEGPAEAQRVDQREERWGDEDAAERGPVEGETHREAAAALEPWREDDVDGRATHGAPAYRHHEEGWIELPGRRHATEEKQAGGHADAGRGDAEVRAEAGG